MYNVKMLKKPFIPAFIKQTWTSSTCKEVSITLLPKPKQGTPCILHKGWCERVEDEGRREFKLKSGVWCQEGGILKISWKIRFPDSLLWILNGPPAKKVYYFLNCGLLLNWKGLSIYPCYYIFTPLRLKCWTKYSTWLSSFWVT
jgi:hypothetical protein